MMEILLYIYVSVMIWIILGAGFVFPDLGRWAVETRDRISGWDHWRECVKAILIWPVFDIKKLREKYDGDSTSS